jgi:hypothetical protein
MCYELWLLAYVKPRKREERKQCEAKDDEGRERGKM